MYKKMGGREILFTRISRYKQEKNINKVELSNLLTYLREKTLNKDYRGQMPNFILQNLFVLKFTIEDARIMLQPNTSNNGIHSILSQIFGFLPFPKTNITYQ